MQEFNVLLSSVRIASECAYGILKGCFLSLKGMGEHKDIQVIYKATETMLVLHNICINTLKLSGSMILQISGQVGMEWKTGWMKMKMRRMRKQK